MAPAQHLERYRAAVERVRLRTLLHLETGRAEPSAPAVAELSRVLEEMERILRVTQAGSRDSALAAALGLGHDEVGFLWTVVAVSADPRMAPHLARLGVDHQRSATVALHARIEQLPGERAVALGLALGPGHPLVRHRLLIAHDPLTPAAGTWQAAHRTAAFLAGDDAPDAELREAGEVVRPPDALLADAATAEAHARLARALAGEAVAVIDGPPGAGRRTAVARACAGRRVVALELARLAPGQAALERALAALVREAVLTGAVPVVAGLDELPASEHGERPLVRLVAGALDSVPGPAAVTTALAGTDLGTRKPQLRVSIPVLPTPVRRQGWDDALAAAFGDRAAGVTGGERDELALRYRLGPGGVAAAVRAAALALPAAAPVTAAALVDGVRNNIAERMGGLAARVTVHQRWDELVLGADTLDQVRGLSARVRHAHLVLERWGLRRKLARGAGVAALFSGPPGTGKTMVAGLIAGELGLELYQVDLSRVVSKWVGETEKQLSRIFDAADAGHALLLFDEADALFAKRTEVKGAIDRYANLEVNYLLQRVEAFGGITILTTNMDTSIDPALIRRLAAHVKFWPPEHDERLRLWRGFVETGEVPRADDLDLDALARRFPEMSGANIRNAAIAAAFLAADEGTALAQRHLERAARGEYASMGRQLSGQSR